MKQRYHLIFICLYMLLGGCAESDLSFPIKEGEVAFRLVLASQESVTMCTRTGNVDDKAINSLTVLVFDGDGENALLAQSPVSVSDWTDHVTENGTVEISMRTKLDDELADKNNLHFLIFANLPANALTGVEAGETKLSEIRLINLSITAGVTDAVVMCGEGKALNIASAGASAEIVTMRRNAASVEVAMEDNGNALEFSVYGAPEAISITAPINSKLPVSSEEGAPSVVVKDSERQYVAPVENNSKEDPYSLSAFLFVVVKAKFDKNDYYYRLAFVNTDASGHETALDINPNHLYKFKIKEVKMPGYATEAEAAGGVPSHIAEVDYTIVDLQPSIFNIASDGRRELGITNKIEDNLGDPCALDFYLKCYPALSDPSELMWQSNSDWVSVDPVPVEVTEVEDADGQKASLFKMHALLQRNPFSEYREASIRVTWAGISTDMTVGQNLNFTGDKHTDISLQILEKDGSMYREITEYWDFVKGVGTTLDAGIVGSSVNAPILYGTTEDVNGGNVRTHGLHFPVLNGGRTYKYTVTPDFVAGSGATKYRAFLKRSFGFTASLHLDTDEKNLGESFTVSMTGDSEQVGVAESILVIMAYDAEGNAVDMLSLDLYYTGLFDWSDYPAYRSDRANDPKIEQAWYYYEVVPFFEGDDVIYWLDRNVGARSRGFDSTDGAGQSLFSEESSYPFLSGDGKAMGGVYHDVAFPNNTYGAPTMDTAFGPLGYRIPTEALFNDLRHSASFVTGRSYTPGGLSYYNAYLLLEGGEKIYFPKNNLYQNGVITSESRMGHYWTSTEATGFEKNEIGKWLTMFTISGNSTSMSRARLIDPRTAMSARLVNEAANKLDYYQTFFKVKGATHVYIYAEHGDQRESPTPWPGTAVSNPDIAYNGFVNFVYESSRNVSYKVIFNFVDENGAVNTMAAAEGEKGIKAIGWPAEGDFEFDTSFRRIN